MSDPYYRWFPGDYMRDTGTLTLIEHGAYRILLDHYYCEEELPNDNPRLYRLCRANTIDEQKAVDYIVSKFFIIEGSRLRNTRADEEIAERKGFLEKQRNNGKLGGRPQTKPTANPTVNPNESLPSPSPLPLEKDQKLSAAEDAAIKIISHYEKEVRVDRDSKYRARRHVQSLMKGGLSKEVLWECVNLYANSADARDPQFRKVAGNFFGRDAVFRGYLDEAKRIVEVEYAAKG